MTQEQNSGFLMKLSILTQSPLRETPTGDLFATLTGVDSSGRIWTTIGVVTNNGFTLNPWRQQPQPVFSPPMPPLPQVDAPAPSDSEAS